MAWKTVMSVEFSPSIEEGEGLRAVAKSTRALTNSDEEMVQRMLPVFDAVYEYCRPRVAGQRDWA